MTPMVFRYLGGLFQLQIQTAEDLERILEVDRARWTATSVPTSQLNCDPVFLRHVDRDDNGRIRVDEVLAAQAWLWERLARRERLAERSEVLVLADLQASHPEAARAKALAERLLKQLGAGATDRISLEQVRSFQSAYASKFPNGDGVLTAGQAPSAEVAALVSEVVALTGGTRDVSGDQGVSAADLDQWVEKVQAFLAWRAQVEGDGAATVLPWGADTAAKVAAIQALSPKVLQFFAQCALVRHEPAAPARLAATPEDLAALDVKDPAAIEAWLAEATLAPPVASGVLDLTGPVNPHFAAALRALATEVLPRALGREPVDRITLADWQTVLAFIQPWLAWRAAMVPGIAEDADPARLAALLESPELKETRDLVAADASVAAEIVEFTTLERLVLHHRWLLELANNFVSFADLFDADRRSLYEVGTLILDGRRLTLCTRVTDLAAHKSLAEHSRIFIAYARLTRKRPDGSDETGLIAAALTAGTRGGVAVGKRGVFYDRDQGEWDAQVVDVIPAPISVWEAAIAPFERMRDTLADKLGKLFTERQAALDSQAQSAAANAELPTGTPPPPRPAGEGGGLNVNTLVVGGSLAFAGLAAALSAVVAAVTAAPFMFIGGLGLLLVSVLAISALIGWWRLRKRDVSAVFEAAGLALNGRMRLSPRIAATFTQRPDLPKGARRRGAPSKAPWLVLGLLLVGAAVGLGWYAWTHPEWLAGLGAGESAPAEAPAEATPAEATPAPAP